MPKGAVLSRAEGKHPRFGVIEFAVGVDVTPAFKAAVAEVPAAEWQPLERAVDGQRLATDQEWAEVCFGAQLGRAPPRRASLPLPGRAGAPGPAGRHRG